MARPRTIDNLPLFAADEDISVALMGPGKASEWRQRAALLEPRGLPKVDAMMGGRYMPAVKRFFDNEYGLIGDTMLAVPDGPEELGACKPRRRPLRG